MDTGEIWCVVSRIIIASPTSVKTSHAKEISCVNSDNSGVATSLIHCAFSKPPRQLAGAKRR